MKPIFKIIKSCSAENGQYFTELYADERFVALISLNENSGQPQIQFPGNQFEESLVLRNIDSNELMQVIKKATLILKDKVA